MNQNFNFLILLSFLFYNSPGNAQTESTAGFIPNGYVLLEEHSGDVNKDGLEDCILIIKNTKEENIVENRFGDIVDRNRRGIIVLLNTENGYEPILKNLDCFSSENEDGGVYYPPELSIEIHTNILKIHYAHGRYGNWEYIFRYGKSDYRLIGYESSENRGPIVNYKTSINFLTKKKQVLENENMNSQDEVGIFKETWEKIKIENLIKLSEIQDFDNIDMTKY
ncbi:hypothetical protein BC962_3053 [Gillisia mitskevichiae]|uniref:Uncharacterized protein n=1 Tax=Gillisia mitskevichiae TaxID=270921 RepID=A0A495NY25_9FLAO|nr:hypothetical protein [Gillisia mitskevichiae]RKS42766.1 hypothetical protein BC962_3053 [Gillisia mitskevichiae]